MPSLGPCAREGGKPAFFWTRRWFWNYQQLKSVEGY